MLTDKHCKNATCPPDRKQARFTDAGGLYLQVSPAGSKRWFYKYRADGKEKQLALGSYPAVGLADARDLANAQKAGGVDPVAARKVERLKTAIPVGTTFKAVAAQWYAKQVPQWSTSHAARSLRQLERDLYPWLGERPMEEIHALELLAVLQKVEERGAIETADRVLMLCRQVWDYWLPTAKTVQRNITEGLKKRFTPYWGKSFAAILEPAPFGELLRAMAAYKGGTAVRTALQLAPLLYQRPGQPAGNGVGRTGHGCHLVDHPQRQDEAHQGRKRTRRTARGAAVYVGRGHVAGPAAHYRAWPLRVPR